MIGVCVAEVCACVREKMQRYLRRGREGRVCYASSTVVAEAHDAGKKYYLHLRKTSSPSNPADACSLVLFIEKAYAVHVRT